MTTTRRRFLSISAGILAAPVIVRASSLMAVRPVDLGLDTLVEMQFPETIAMRFTYVIFDNLCLADYEDRIPNLRFIYPTGELIAA